MIYPHQCLERAIAAYSEYCSINIQEVSAMGCIIEIDCRTPAETDERKIVNEFLNYLFDASVEKHLG